MAASRRPKRGSLPGMSAATACFLALPAQAAMWGPSDVWSLRKWLALRTQWD